MINLEELFYDSVVERIGHFEHVGSYDISEMYEWDMFHVFWDPHTREFVWAYGSGCSCDWIREIYPHESDMPRGNREAVLRALKDYHYSGYQPGQYTDQYTRLKEKIRAW